MSYNFQSFKDEAKKIEDWLGKEFTQIHSGRATPALLDGILVDSYGAKSAITHVASISIEDPKTLRVSPWDKSQIKEIERAIVAANLGLGTAVDDGGIRITFPSLTTERRKDLTKIVYGKLEEARVKTRSAREKIWDDVQKKQKEGILTEDEKFRYKDELQKLTDEINKKLESMAGKKEAEIMN